MIIREGVNKGMEDATRLMEGLAKAKDRILFEKAYERRGSKTTVRYTMGEMLEGIKDEKVRLMTALMMHNQQEYYDALDETTRLQYVGSFDRWAFPIVRAVFPNLIAHELVSTQPMQGPTSLVFFLKFLYGVTKGTAVAGRDIIENPSTSFTSKEIDSEQLDVGTGAVAQYTGNLAWVPALAGRLQIVTSDGLLVTDDGAGALIGDVNAGGNNTINYSTGAYDVTFSANITAAATIDASYDYDNEGTYLQPETDMVLTSRPVTAQADRIVSKWSLDVQTDYKIVHGLDAEVELVAAQVSEMKYEIDHKIINDLFRISTNVQPAWSRTVGAGVSYTEHKLSFLDSLVQAQNRIYSTTQRAEAEWIVAGVGVCNVIETLPGFKRTGGAIKGRGVHKIGVLNNQWTVYKDSYINTDTYLMGHKGDNMWDTGYIYAPYQMFTQTPTITLTDFLVRKGTWSRYGRMPVDGGFYCTGTITA